jgi:hypothetical protein
MMINYIGIFFNNFYYIEGSGAVDKYIECGGVCYDSSIF